MSYYAELLADDGSDIIYLGDGERKELYTDKEDLKYADKDYDTLIKLIYGEKDDKS